MSLLLSVIGAMPGNCMAPEPGWKSGRELIDPCVGARWRLVMDSAHPARPGRLELVSMGAADTSRKVAVPFDERAAAGPEIRAGDRVMVEQQTRLLHARFAAVALEPAQTGKPVRVRLDAGRNTAPGLSDSVITVLATGPGEARWTSAERIGQ